MNEKFVLPIEKKEPDQNLEKFLDLLIAKNQDLAVAAKESGVALNKETAGYLMGRGGENLVANNLTRFEGLNQEIAEKIIEEGKGVMVAGNLTLFKGLNHQEIAKKLIEAGKGFEVAENLTSFEGLNHQEIAEKLIEADQGDAVARNLTRFEGLNQEIAEKLIEEGMGHAVARNLTQFEGLNHQEIARKLIETRQRDAVAENLIQFEGLNQEIARDLIEAGFVFLVANNRESFVNLKDKALDKTIEIMGAGYVTKEFYAACKDILNGTISPEMRGLGVRHEGDTGLNELKQWFKTFQRGVISGERREGAYQELHDSRLLQQYLKGVVHYEGSNWGDHDEDSFAVTITNYFEAEIQPLPPEYEPSEVAQIQKIDQQAIAEYKHSKEFFMQYGKLLGDMQTAHSYLKREQGINGLLAELEQKTQTIIHESEEKLQSQKNPKAIENLTKKLEALKKLNFKELEKPHEMFEVLSEYKELHPTLRQLIFYFGLKLNETYDKDLIGKDSKNPQLDDLTWTIDFIDHIVNQETFSKYFQSKIVAKRFEEMTSTRELQESLARWQNQGTKGTMSMQFVPQRNILTEFSGHIADACWASRYPSILGQFQNFTSLMFVQNPESEKDFTIAGAAFLIEAKDAAGNDVMVVRGLNPRENVINQLSRRDFMDKLIAYLKPIAQKKGMKKIVMPIDHSGGASTNRPALFDYLQNAYLENGRKVTLASDPVTTFNGYDITNECWLLAEIE